MTMDVLQELFHNEASVGEDSDSDRVIIRGA